ncbi:MAG: hypothetical protein HY507_00905 [Candidatus Zambryskibacteria bacterium]|nr:hypothetical protein [Candidatus Zambryskibacteria bacterium]
MKNLRFTILLLVIILPIFAFAQGEVNSPGGGGNVTIPNPLKCAAGQDCGSFMSLLTAILNNIVMPVAAVAVVAYIIWAGFTYVTAQGNPKKIDEAHQRLLWALVGAGILLGAAAISRVVQTTVTSLIN